MAGLTDTDDKGETEDSDLYTIIGAASGVLLILILSILMLTWFRRRKFDASVKYPIRSTLMKRLFKIYLKTKIMRLLYFLSFFNRTMPLLNRFFRTMLLTNPVEKARLSWFVFFALFWIEELPVYIYTDLWLGDSFNRSNILYFQLCLSYRNPTWRIFRGVYFQVTNSPDNVFSLALI